MSWDKLLLAGAMVFIGFGAFTSMGLGGKALGIILFYFAYKIYNAKPEKKKGKK